MVDRSAMKLGNIAAGPTPHLPDLGTYAAKMPLPIPPDIIDWGRECPWPMLANDRISDCVQAALLHFITAVGRWAHGVGVVPTDAQAIALYSYATGYDSTRPETDMGTKTVDVMTSWATKNMLNYGKLLGLVRVNASNALQMRQALYLCGPLIVCAGMPERAQTQRFWSTPSQLTGPDAPDSWGGHAMLLTRWAPEAVNLITWGTVQQCDPGWIAAYSDEVWAILHPDWVMSGHSPTGKLANLVAQDMSQLSDRG